MHTETISKGETAACNSRGNHPTAALLFQSSWLDRAGSAEICAKLLQIVSLLSELCCTRQQWSDGQALPV